VDRAIVGLFIEKGSHDNQNVTSNIIRLEIMMVNCLQDEEQRITSPESKQDWGL
jgi:hypothetical protein